MVYPHKGALFDNSRATQGHACKTRSRKAASHEQQEPTEKGSRLQFPGAGGQDGQQLLTNAEAVSLRRTNALYQAAICTPDPPQGTPPQVPPQGPVQGAPDRGPRPSTSGHASRSAPLHASLLADLHWQALRLLLPQ